MPRHPGIPAAVSFHPATWLLVWAGAILFLQSLAWCSLSLVTLAAILAAIVLARSRMTRLIFRARWLLLTIAVLFAAATPGQRLPGVLGDLGVTLEGVSQAAEHVLRLLSVLATLAVVHQRLGNEGMIAGFHLLLAPLASFAELRRRIVVRLLLVLEYVETAPRVSWRYWLAEGDDEPSMVTMQHYAVGILDAVIVAFLIAALVGWYP